MKKFAFISRHKATPEQHNLAADQDILLVEVGDLDAFTVSTSGIDEIDAFDGVIVVHPAAALSLCGQFLVGVFENGNRAPEGERPNFFAKALHVYDNRD